MTDIMTDNMIGKIKDSIQKKLNDRCYEKYLNECERQKDPYRQWYLVNEDWKKKAYPAPDPDIVIFCDAKGKIEEKAAGVAGAFFKENPHVLIAYADEDCIDSGGERHSPWFKPAWSPDTLRSFQYFGHFVAVRTSLLKGMDRSSYEPYLKDLSSSEAYLFLISLADKVNSLRPIRANDEKKEIMPIGKVLFHMPREKDEPEYEDVAIEPTGTGGFSAPGNAAVPLASQALVKVSAIIPSKDNPKALELCLKGLREGTDLCLGIQSIDLEIIVVDNGSSPENKARIEGMSSKYNFRYLYRPEPFNFSSMCNYGARNSAGEYLLLLNDDIEIIQPDWLLRMLSSAQLSHAGAVGAKLLYPGSDLIQHIGITNIQVGPVHKLLKQEDNISHYHGQNRHIYDMIGVTAACFVVSRDKYVQAGGFFEGLAVAYNDVDFCFALYELGYYNIFRGDVTLLHHESLSRGDDNLSDEKWIRLLKEKATLYSRHPKLKGKDPFYSENLADFSNLYLPNFKYECDKRDFYTRTKPYRGAEPLKWQNDSLVVNVEHSKEVKKLELDEPDTYRIDGWAYVLWMDNSRYEKTLLFISDTGDIYESKPIIWYRKDVEDVLDSQENVALSGFICNIPKGVLPKGSYTIAMLAKDRCSRQRLYRRTDEILEVL